MRLTSTMRSHTSIGRVLEVEVPVGGLDARVVDEHVEATEGSHGLGHHPLRVLHGRHVADRGDDPGTAGCELAGQALGSLRVEVRHRHHRALPGERAHDALADAQRAAGHQHGPALELAHPQSPISSRVGYASGTPTRPSTRKRVTCQRPMLGTRIDVPVRAPEQDVGGRREDRALRVGREHLEPQVLPPAIDHVGAIARDDHRAVRRERDAIGDGARQLRQDPARSRRAAGADGQRDQPAGRALEHPHLVAARVDRESVGEVTGLGRPDARARGGRPGPRSDDEHVAIARLPMARVGDIEAAIGREGAPVRGHERHARRARGPGDGIAATGGPAHHGSPSRIAGVDAALAVRCQAERPAAGRGHLVGRAILADPVDLSLLAAHVARPVRREADALGMVDARSDLLQPLDRDDGSHPALPGVAGDDGRGPGLMRPLLGRRSVRACPIGQSIVNRAVPGPGCPLSSAGSHLLVARCGPDIHTEAFHGTHPHRDAPHGLRHGDRHHRGMDQAGG